MRVQNKPVQEDSCRVIYQYLRPLIAFCSISYVNISHSYSAHYIDKSIFDFHIFTFVGKKPGIIILVAF